MSSYLIAPHRRDTRPTLKMPAAVLAELVDTLKDEPRPTRQDLPAVVVPAKEGT